jgi:TetR/AcrR family transcriptional regulator
MKPKNTSDSRSRQTRDAILCAGIKEFSEYGIAGARTEAIAAASGVNKALLHYYFKSKDGLYRAVLQNVFGGVLEQSLAILESKTSPGERLLRWNLQHFDRMVAHREYQNLMQQEMIRVRQGESASLPLLVSTYFRPVTQKIVKVIKEGVRSGELCDMEPLQIAYSLFGVNASYFMSAPIMRLAASFEPFSPASLARRRKASLTFLALALFVDRAHGNTIAQRILAETPMPKPAAKFSSKGGRRP